MRDFFIGLGMVLVVLSVITFFIGFILMLIKNTRTTGIRMVIISIIAFIIGFGTCSASFQLNL